MGTTVLAGLAVILERATHQCAQDRGAEAATPAALGSLWGPICAYSPTGIMA